MNHKKINKSINKLTNKLINCLGLPVYWTSAPHSLIITLNVILFIIF